MALTMSEIQAITEDIWEPGSQQNWQQGNILMHELLAKVEKIGSGEKVRAVLVHKKSRGGPMGATTRFNTARKDQINAARFPWAYFWSGVTIDLKDETQVNGGHAEVDMVLTKLDNAQTTMRQIMGDSLFTRYATMQATYGGETEPFFGIADLMYQTNTSPAFGSINKADLGEDEYGSDIWLAYENTGGLVMNFATMQTLRQNCRVGNGTKEKPNLYVTTETLKDAFENSLQAAQRHHNPRLVEAGFDNIMFGQAPVVADDKCTAKYVHGLNMEYLMLKAHQDMFFTKPNWKEPTDQHIKTTQMEFAGAFCTNQRRAHGRLTNVT